MSQSKSKTGIKKSKPLGRPHKAKPGELDLREKIIDAAVDIFARKGIAASSLKEISLAAGATPAVIYYHFNTRDNLVETALKARLKPVLDDIWSVVHEEGQALDTAMAIQERLIHHALELPWFLSLWSREFASEDGSLRDYAAKHLPFEKLRSLVAKIKTAQKKKLINPDLSAEMVFISIVGSTLFPLMTRASWVRNFEEPITAATVIGHVRSMLVRGLAPGGTETKLRP